MGSLICLLDESHRRFVQVADCYTLNLKGTRHFQASALRYCLRGNELFLPSDISIQGATFGQRLCWARLRFDVIDELDFAFKFNEPVPDYVSFDDLEEEGVGFGSRYLQRHQELDGRRVPVAQFCSETLIEGIKKNPEALDQVSKEEFEALCAELFVSRGFEVDLYRKTKDGGIDFLAIKGDDTDPLLFAVQCKHPDPVRASGKKSRTLPVTTVREVYGVAKANDLSGGIAITSAEYSPEAKQFSELKPHEIEVYDRSDILKWIERFRWNTDEMS
jgi:HJR/Mrr/RecB family endonuclease